jgi:hypothetical protein
MGKATAADEPTTSMTREEYQVGAEQQPAGRFERISRVVVAMAPERVGHNRRKRRTYEVLDRAVRAEGCRARPMPTGSRSRLAIVIMNRRDGALRRPIKR